MNFVQWVDNFRRFVRRYADLIFSIGFFAGIAFIIDFANSAEDAASALSGLGALAVSVFTFYATLLRPYLRRAALRVGAAHEESESPEGNSYFLRLRIVNIGYMPAQGCVVRLMQVITQDKATDKWMRLPFPPLELYWAYQNRNGRPYAALDILGYQDYQIVDIAQVTMTPAQSLVLRVVVDQPLVGGSFFRYTETAINPITLEWQRDYYFLIGIYAQNGVFRAPSWYKLRYVTEAPFYELEAPDPTEKLHLRRFR